MPSSRNFTAEAAALPNHDFDLLMHGYMMRTFEPYFKGTEALELGCYKGEFTKRIAKRYTSVTVVDGSVENVLDAVEVSGSRGFCEDFEHVVLPSQYDAIFLIHALEHCDNPVLVLKRCREWLKPNGRLFVAVPNAGAASRRLAVSMGLVESCEAVTDAERAHGHRKTYSLETLGRVIGEAGGLFSVAHGGIVFKPLANFQMDKALSAGIIDTKYLDACYDLGKLYPELCSSIYAVCSR